MKTLLAALPLLVMPAANAALVEFTALGEVTLVSAGIPPSTNSGSPISLTALIDTSTPRVGEDFPTLVGTDPTAGPRIFGGAIKNFSINVGAITIAGDDGSVTLISTVDQDSLVLSVKSFSSETGIPESFNLLDARFGFGFPANTFDLPELTLLQELQSPLDFTSSNASILFSTPFGGGEQIEGILTNASIAAIPLPASIWLLFSACGALLLRGKTRKESFKIETKGDGGPTL